MKVRTSVGSLLTRCSLVASTGVYQSGMQPVCAMNGSVVIGSLSMSRKRMTSQPSNTQTKS